MGACEDRYGFVRRLIWVNTTLIHDSKKDQFSVQVDNISYFSLPNHEFVAGRVHFMALESKKIFRLNQKDF